METLKKTITVATVPPEGAYTGYGEVEIEISIKHEGDKVRLSISGEVGYRTEDEDGYDTDELCMCGQIGHTLKELYEDGTLHVIIPKDNFLKLLEVWDRWHLNDMVAGCPHQMEILRADPERPRDYDELIKDPVFKQCPECGYSYGSKWLYEEVPSDVWEFLEAL